MSEKVPSLAALNAALVAPLALSMWSQGGFAASQPRVISPSAFPEAVGCEYQLDGGNKTFFLPLSARASSCHEKCSLNDLIEPVQLAPDVRLLCRIYLQPIAILALSGMALLTWCCFDENRYSDALLTLVGGRSNGWLLLIAAHAAHLCEASVAMYSCLTGPHRLPLSAALRWSFPVCFVGYPALQWVFELNKAGQDGKNK